MGGCDPSGLKSGKGRAALRLVGLKLSVPELVLVQLKWPDIYGRSLAERDSRRLNLLKANDWVDKVHGWIAGRTADEVAQALGLGRGNPRPPILLVIARHTAQFSRERGFDPRARWISWPSLVGAYKASQKAGLVSALRRPKTPNIKPSVSVHDLPGLKVEVRAG